MSVARTKHCTIRYRFNFQWSLDMIPWYRQLLALVFGLGVMLIALWGIQQGSGAWLISSVAGMAFLSLLLIFGIEVDTVEFGKVKIDFSNTTTQSDDDE